MWKGGKVPNQLGPLETTNFDHWIQTSSIYWTHLSGDVPSVKHNGGNKSRFRNVISKTQAVRQSYPRKRPWRVTGLLQGYYNDLSGKKLVHFETVTDTNIKQPENVMKFMKFCRDVLYVYVLH
jgi:hypothetical protein